MTCFCKIVISFQFFEGRENDLNSIFLRKNYLSDLSKFNQNIISFKTVSGNIDRKIKLLHAND